MTYDKKLSIYQQRKKLYDKYFRRKRPGLKLTIADSSPMDVLDVYQDEYGVFFAKYFNSSAEKIEIENSRVGQILEILPL